MIEISAADLPTSVGQQLGPGEWMTVTQEQVNTFADATHDHQWIHVDVEQATAGPFGGPIAHGYLTLSLVPALQKTAYRITGAAMGINYGLNKVRFLTPVRVGERIRLTATVASVDARPDGSFLVTTDNVVEIEGADKPACVAQTLGVIVPG